MPSSSLHLVLTKQERAALSAALHTLLKLWGDSEDAGQERIHVKLRSIAAKVEALESEHGEPARKQGTSFAAQHGSAPAMDDSGQSPGRP